MPMVVLVNRLPITEVLGRVQRAGRCMEDEMEVFSNRADPLQGPPQQRGEIYPQAWFVQPRSFK